MPVIFASLVFAISLSLLPYVTEDQPDQDQSSNLELYHPLKEKRQLFDQQFQLPEGQVEKVENGQGQGHGLGSSRGQSQCRPEITRLKHLHIQRSLSTPDIGGRRRCVSVPCPTRQIGPNQSLIGSSKEV